MLKRTPALVLILGVVVWTFSSCNSSSSSSSTVTPGKGTLFVYVGDVPLCDVLNFRVGITEMKLISQTGGSNAQVFNPVNTFIKVNFGSLRDSSTILGFNNVQAGTYQSGTFSLSIPQLIEFDPTMNPPINSLIATLTTSSPTISFAAPLQITANKISAIRVDLDLRHSVNVDSNGQATGNMNLIFQGVPQSYSTSRGYGEFDNLIGFVRSINSVNPPPPGFTGDFDLQLLSGTGSDITVEITDNTQFYGLSSFSDLLTGDFLEVDGYIDANGNLVANSIVMENHEDVAQNISGFLGTVLSATKDANGNLASFDLDVNESEPDVSVDVPLDSVVSVNLSPNTTYGVASPTTNFANLSLTANSIAVGQQVAVHGTYTKGSGSTPTTITADKVFTELQAIEGSFSSPIQVGSDNKTGAFWFSPCFSLLKTTPTLVFTSGSTVFNNVAGLKELTSQPSLLIRGLPFLETQGTTINGITVPAGTLVILAKQVHQLN